MQNYSELQEQLRFTATISSSMETKSVEFENDSFPTATHQPENVVADKNIKPLNVFIT